MLVLKFEDERTKLEEDDNDDDFNPEDISPIVKKSAAKGPGARRKRKKRVKR